MTERAEKTPLRVEQVEHLDREVQRVYEILSSIGFRRSHYLQDRVVFGYVWQAAATAEVMVNEFRARHPYGLWPSLRQLSELVVDLSFLEINPDPDVVAAKIILAEVSSLRRHIEAGLEIEEEFADEELEIPEQREYWRQDLPSIIEDLKGYAVRMGGERNRVDEIFDTAKNELDERRNWHWSGMSFPKRVDWLRDHGNLSRTSELILKTLYYSYSGRAHATANFLRMAVQIGDRGTHELHAPSYGDVEEMRELAGPAAGFLRIISDLVDHSDIGRQAGVDP